MRCLFCGKELALLKRLRGGGEFCSEAHRLQYQEQYNELALNRLLQAQPVASALAPEQPPLEIPHCPPVTLPAQGTAAKPAAKAASAESVPPAPLWGFIKEKPVARELRRDLPTCKIELDPWATVAPTKPSGPAFAVSRCRNVSDRKRPPLLRCGSRPTPSAALSSVARH